MERVFWLVQEGGLLNVVRAVPNMGGTLRTEEAVNAHNDPYPY